MVVKLQLASLAETGVGRRPAVGHRHARRHRGHLRHRLPADRDPAEQRHPRRHRRGHRRSPAWRSACCCGAGRPAAPAGCRSGLLVLAVVGGGAGRGRADPVRGGDRLPLRPGGGRSRAGHRPGAVLDTAAALLRRPRRPHVPGVRVRPRDRRGHRRRCAPSGRAAVGPARRRRRADAAALPGRGAAGHREPGARGRPRGGRHRPRAAGAGDLRPAAGAGRRRPGRAGRRAGRGAGPRRRRRLRRAVGAVAARPPARRSSSSTGRWPTTASTRSTSSTTRRWASSAPSWPRCGRCSRTSRCSPARRCSRGEDGGNVVAVASRSPLPAEALAARGWPTRDLAWQVAEGAELDRFVGDAAVLTDDFAPVDQLLTPYGS